MKTLDLYNKRGECTKCIPSFTGMKSLYKTAREYRDGYAVLSTERMEVHNGIRCYFWDAEIFQDGKVIRTLNHITGLDVQETIDNYMKQEFNSL